MATRYPNGLETGDLSCENVSASGNLAVSGDTELKKVTAENIIGSVERTSLSVDCSDNVTLSNAQKLVDDIVISASGTSKVLTLGMAVGKLITIKNSGENGVTVKNESGDTGVTATAAKTALFLITSGEILKVTADA